MVMNSIEIRRCEARGKPECETHPRAEQRDPVGAAEANAPYTGASIEDNDELPDLLAASAGLRRVPSRVVGHRDSLALERSRTRRDGASSAA